MRLRLPHRHLTLERYELALEERPARARRMRERAARCQRCLAELSQAPLGPVLAAWQMPAGATEWRRAVRRALTPAVRGPAAGPARRRRLAAAPAAAAALALLAAVPATANATPASPLFAVRGLEEEARWSLTPADRRAGLAADLASAYGRQAGASAGRGDRAAHDASMDRFLRWGGRMRTDVGGAGPPAAARNQPPPSEGERGGRGAAQAAPEHPAPPTPALGPSQRGPRTGGGSAGASPARASQAASGTRRRRPPRRYWASAL